MREKKRGQAAFLCLDPYNVHYSLVHAVCCVCMSTGNSQLGRQTGSDDRGGIGVRIDAQEARAPVEDVRKVARPLFLALITELSKFTIAIICLRLTA